MVDAYLKGTDRAHFSLIELRKAVCPGVTLFDPKDRGHISNLIFEIISRVTELHSQSLISRTRHDTLIGELKTANNAFMNITNTAKIKEILDQWHMGIRYQSSFCSSAFLVDAKVIGTTNTTWTGYQGNRSRSNRVCWVCKEPGHTKYNCPYAKGKLLPIDKLCPSFNAGTCRKGKNCPLLHFCSKCRTTVDHSALDCQRQ